MLRAGATLALLAVCHTNAREHARNHTREHVPEHVPENHTREHVPEHALEPQPLPQAGSSPEDYLRRYAGKWVPEIKNASDGKEWQDAFMKRYAPEYSHYVQDWKQTAALLAAAPQEPSMCSDMQCLDAWYRAQLAMLKQYVPESAAPFAEASLNKEYQHYKQIIESRTSTPAPTPSPGPTPASTPSPGLLELAAGAQEPEKGSPEWYVKHYAGKWVHKVHNVSDGQEWYENYMKQYAARYMHYAEDYQRLAAEFVAAPDRASDCHSLAELKMWRDARMAYIKAYVPKAFQGFALANLDNEFENNKARIMAEHANATNATPAWVEFVAAPGKAPENPRDEYAAEWVPHPPEWYINHYAGHYAHGYVPPVHNASDAQEWHQHYMGRYAEAYKHYSDDEERIDREFGDAPQNASDCHTMAELRRWRQAQLARIQAFVPKTYQDTAKGAVQRELEENQARIASEARPAPEAAPQVLVAIAVEGHPKTTAGLMAEYAQLWVPAHNTSDGQEWRQHYMSKYAEAYKHYADDSERISREHAAAPQHASDARSIEELEAWKEAQVARIDAFVPKTFQKVAKEAVDSSFRRHRALLEKAAAPQEGGAAAAPQVAAEQPRAASSMTAVSVLLAVSIAGAAVVLAAFHIGSRCAERDDMADGYMQV